MRDLRKIQGYYFITDSGLSRMGNEHDVREAYRAGTTIFQYRNKTSSTRLMIEEAKKLRSLCPSAIFLINDRVDIALAVGADGVHLGNDDMPYRDARRLLGDDAIIGITAHSVAESVAAEKNGADYVGVSPIFSTSTKPDAGKPAGVRLVSEVKSAVKIPVVAIGGINLSNAQSVVEAGADAVCAISAVVCSTDVAGEVGKFQKLFANR